MYDSRSNHARNGLHALRSDDTWYVKGVLTVHPAKPTLSKHEAIGEGVLEWLDVAEQANCLDDGLVIDCESIDWDAPWWRVPHTSESSGYAVRIAARVEPKAPAKVYRARDLDPYTGEPIRSIHPAGFIRATTRKVRR